jgi:murein DD-endopeptidase MepM/ murein hydrolase activator NlpD
VVLGINVKALLLSAVLVASPAIASADLDLPVKGVVTSGVGWRMDPFGTGKLVFHRGLDIAVPVGTPVHPTRRGHVVLAGEDHHGHGSTVIIQHDNGDRTLYGHNSVILVHRGDFVEAGAVVALSGSSGRSTGPHVHYEQQPGGHPIAADKIEIAETSVGRSDKAHTESRAPRGVERQVLERKMDDSVDSILKAIGSTALSGQGDDLQ